MDVEFPLAFRFIPVCLVGSLGEGFPRLSLSLPYGSDGSYGHGLEEDIL